MILLKGQSSAAEEKERAIKIFEKKLMVYSNFMEHLWEMFSDSKVTSEELTNLRNISFKQLVFFLDNEQIQSITEQMKAIANDETGGIKEAAQITYTLKNNLGLVSKEKPRKEGQKDVLIDLFRSFKPSDDKNTSAESKTAAAPSPALDSSQQSFEGKDGSRTTYWHFAMYNEEQIKVLKKDNGKEETILGFFEGGASWRTEYARRVKKDDVIFLFRRGGAGYIGAFRAKEPKVFEWAEYEKDFENFDVRYDMYGCFADGSADYLANIIARPLAFNYKGVGCKSPRRKTIEPINDIEAVNYLLTRFSGNELDAEQQKGMNKLESDKPVIIQDDDKAFFEKLAKTTIG
jgi:hypothetical protein